MPRDVEEKPVPAGAGAAAGSAPSAAAAGSAPPPAADLQVDAKTVSHWNQWERFKVLFTLSCFQLRREGKSRLAGT